jgi:hypothetical protein
MFEATSLGFRLRLVKREKEEMNLVDGLVTTQSKILSAHLA